MLNMHEMVYLYRHVFKILQSVVWNASEVSFARLVRVRGLGGREGVSGGEEALVPFSRTSGMTNFQTILSSCQKYYCIFCVNGKLAP
jgi:hypothetical protein